MPLLVDRATDAPIMEITAAQLGQLQDAMEEEFEEDRDYYLTSDTLDYLLAQGVDADVVEGLRAALGTREGLDVAWRGG
jgi:processive 1,2-diacylglycerol beta-glucosyltransferase